MSAKRPDDQAECHLPAASCLAAQEQFQHVAATVEDLKQSMQRVEGALRGNEELGHRGIVTRLNVIERVLLILAACVVVIGGEKMVKLFF
jgi:hypothetical protein